MLASILSIVGKTSAWTLSCFNPPWPRLEPLEPTSAIKRNRLAAASFPSPGRHPRKRSQEKRPLSDRLRLKATYQATSTALMGVVPKGHDSRFCKECGHQATYALDHKPTESRRSGATGAKKSVRDRSHRSAKVRQSPLIHRGGCLPVASSVLDVFFRTSRVNTKCPCEVTPTLRAQARLQGRSFCSRHSAHGASQGTASRTTHQRRISRFPHDGKCSPTDRAHRPATIQTPFQDFGCPKQSNVHDGLSNRRRSDNANDL